MTIDDRANVTVPRIALRMRSQQRADREIEKARHTNLPVSKTKSKMLRRAKQAARKERHLLSRSDEDPAPPRQLELTATFLEVAFIGARKRRNEIVSGEEERHL